MLHLYLRRSHPLRIFLALVMEDVSTSAGTHRTVSTSAGGRAVRSPARSGAARQSDRDAVFGCAADGEPVYRTTDDQEDGDDVP